MENVIERIRPGAPQPTLAATQQADVDELRLAIGLHLRSIRLNRGATIKTVCEATGIYPSHLSRVEGGKASLDIRQAFALANAYDLRIEEILGVDND